MSGEEHGRHMSPSPLALIPQLLPLLGFAQITVHSSTLNCSGVSARLQRRVRLGSRSRGVLGLRTVSTVTGAAGSVAHSPAPFASLPAPLVASVTVDLHLPCQNGLKRSTQVMLPSLPQCTQYGTCTANQYRPHPDIDMTWYKYRYVQVCEDNLQVQLPSRS